MAGEIGQVVAVSDVRMTAAVALDSAARGPDGLQLGKLMTVAVDGATVVGLVSALKTSEGDGRHCQVVADLLGEIATGAEGKHFSRGVSSYPALGAPVAIADGATADLVYGAPDGAHVRIGSLCQDPSRVAYLRTDDLLGRNFAVLGTTGSGKSCAVTVILRAVLEAHPNAHIVLLDPHNEYSAAFGDVAEIVNVDTLHLPCWLLDFEESVGVLVRGGTSDEQETQAAILKDVITQARRKYAGQATGKSDITVDTPSPYLFSDLMQLIEQAMGKLANADKSASFLRLKERLESLSADRRFSFLFSGMVTRDDLSQVVGRLLRIPVASKPITIIDLSGVPSDIVDAIVSMFCRLTFDVALWADRTRMPPVLLVCEEAHRYIPARRGDAFAAATRAIERIAKEGRKYGVALGLVTQRPSELSESALTQCGTIFALRLNNEVDRNYVENVMPDGMRGLLEALPALRRQEAIIVGEGVGVAMRIHFDDLPAGHRPRSMGARFSKAWGSDEADKGFVDDTIRRWRRQTRE